MESYKALSCLILIIATWYGFWCVLRSGWCGSYRSCMKITGAECALVVKIEEFRTGCPWKNLCADDLVVISESLEVLQKKLVLWENNMERKMLRVNIGKTKVLISGPGLCRVSQGSRHTPFSVGVVPVGSTRNAVVCLALCMKPNPSFRCKRFSRQSRPVDGRPMTEVTMSRETLEVVPSFSYVGDCLSSGGSEFASITRCRVAWGKCNEHLPTLTPAHFPSPPEKEFTIRVSGAPCAQNLGPKLLSSGSPTTQWPGFDALFVRCHHRRCNISWKGIQLNDLSKLLRARRLRWHSHFRT